MRRTIIFSAILFILPIFLFGQPRDYTSKNSKAIKAVMTGEYAMAEHKFEYAELNFLEAIEKDPNFIEAYINLADACAAQGKFMKAIESLRKAIEINPSFFHNNYFFLAKYEMGEGLYEDAEKHFKLFLAIPVKNQQMVMEANADLANCKFAKEALKKPVPFDPVNLGPGINSEMDEYFPCLTADDRLMLFTRRINMQPGTDAFNEDFYVSLQQKEQWMKSINIGAPINSANNEGAPTLSTDGNILVFTGCEVFGNYGPNRKGFGSCDLFVSQRIGDNWSQPVNLGPAINTSNWETQPSLAADGKTLYFVRGLSTRSGIQHQDIYVTEINDEGQWSTPVKLNKNVNTDMREESVFIHPDGQTLYFSSNGHPGMGGLDIFMSRKDSTGEWGRAINLGYPINTFNNENSLMVDARGKLGYFASNRTGGQGGLDMYSFVLPEKIKPQLVTYMKGKVFDATTKKPLYTKFELIDLETGKVAIESWSNKGNGEFLVPLPTNRNYALNVSKSGYLFFSENFTLTGKAENGEPFYTDVPLQPIKIGEKVILKNIFFETAKYDLKPESHAELKKLVQFLNENAVVKIELSGHTDNVGKDESNQTLSENRAKTVYDYLVGQGIDQGRLTYKGYGESQPVATNETEAGRAQNRRTEFKIVE